MPPKKGSPNPNPKKKSKNNISVDEFIKEAEKNEKKNKEIQQEKNKLIEWEKYRAKVNAPERNNLKEEKKYLGKK